MGGFSMEKFFGEEGETKKEKVFPQIIVLKDWLPVKTDKTYFLFSTTHFLSTLVCFFYLFCKLEMMIVKLFVSRIL